MDFGLEGSAEKGAVEGEGYGVVAGFVNVWLGGLDGAHTRYHPPRPSCRRWVSSIRYRCSCCCDRFVREECGIQRCSRMGRLLSRGHLRNRSWSRRRLPGALVCVL